MTWRDQYPFESRYVSVGTDRLHYVDEGPGGDAVGGPVLMVHGNPTWSFYYRQLIRSLAPKRRAIAVDHLGCGLSDKPQTATYDLPSHIDRLVNLIDDLDLQNTTLVAHDWGGAIGLGALLARRDRFARIVLFNTGAFPPPYIPFRIQMCRWPLVGTWAVRGRNLFARAATTMATEQQGGLPREVSEGLLAPYDSWDHRIAIDRFVKDIPANRRHPTWSVLASIEQQLAEVADWPILLIWGMRDWCFRPDCLDRFVRHWPTAEVVKLEQAGHYVVEDAIEQVVPQLEQFLNQHDR